jgi:hypothetical protein
MVDCHGDEAHLRNGHDSNANDGGGDGDELTERVCEAIAQSIDAAAAAASVVAVVAVIVQQRCQTLAHEIGRVADAAVARRRRRLSSQTVQSTPHAATEPYTTAALLQVCLPVDCSLEES